jgi:hypothetical protein
MFKRVYKAKLRAQPASWNTFHYIVDILTMGAKDTVLYFSEAAVGKPVDVEVGQEGFVYFDGTVYHWSSDEIKEVHVDDEFEDTNLNNWFAL